MQVIVVHSSPNQDGLTAACAEAACAGARQAGADVRSVRLNDLNIGMCQACDNGWGSCRQDHTCQTADDFNALHDQICAADGLILVSPVYWGEMSESMKALADRLRRCEATLGDASRLAGKPYIAVAAAGGSGGGAVTCLLNMERWGQHVRARVFDLLPVNRWSRPYKLQAIQAAAETMVREATATG